MNMLTKQELPAKTVASLINKYGVGLENFLDTKESVFMCYNIWDDLEHYMNIRVTSLSETSECVVYKLSHEFQFIDPRRPKTDSNEIITTEGEVSASSKEELYLKLYSQYQMFDSMFELINSMYTLFQTDRVKEMAQVITVSKSVMINTVNHSQCQSKFKNTMTQVMM